MRLIKDNVERVADGEQADKLKALGFQEIGSTATETVGSEDKSPDKMSAAELKALAKKKGIEGASSLTKSELLAVLKDVMNGD